MKKKYWSKKTWSVLLSASLVIGLYAPMGLAYENQKNAEVTNQKTVSGNEPQQITSVYGDETRTWNLHWNDEFNDGNLDETKWSYMIGTGAEYAGDGWGNNEEQYYTEGDNLSFGREADGDETVEFMRITARKETKENKSYTSTRLWGMDDSHNKGGDDKTAKFTKKYGRIEAKVRIPEAQTGAWPAFWMMPAYDAYGGWASSGEIDIMEIRGREPEKVDGTIHYGEGWPNNKSVGGVFESTDPDFVEEWHTYAVEWLPGQLRWYVDDTMYYETSDWFSTTNGNAADFTYPAPFDQEFYILLNLAIGGNYDQGALDPALIEQHMDVDYVRVYDLVDQDTGQIGIYDEDVTKPVDLPDDDLVEGSIDDNYVDSPLENIRNTTGYPDEADKTDWFLSELSGGAATASMDDDALKIDVTDAGSADYAVQLIHRVPLTKGYRYVMKFSGKAETAKTIAAKFGNISGWPAYSSVYDVNLTTGWKEYEYVFDMTNQTDADGRIEFNMNQNTGAVFLKDFEIYSTGQIPVEDPNGEKTPLADGNHVYNGTFDQGEGRIQYWNAGDNTDISSSREEKQLKVVGTDSLSGVFQSGINLLQNDSYQLFFDAKAENDTTITVLLKSADGTATYCTETVNIGVDYQNPYEVNFTMNQDVTDTAAVLVFQTGVQTVCLDNVKLFRTTNNNMDWSCVDIWPLYNDDFFNGTDGWNIWSEGGGWIGDVSTENGYLEARTSVETGANFWCVGVQTSPMSLTGGLPYHITIHLDSGADKVIKVGTPDGAEVDYTFSEGENHIKIPFTPKADMTDGKVTLFFGLEAGEYSFKMTGIDVEIDPSAGVPEGNAKPGSVKSAGSINAGKDVTILHNNDTWAEEITVCYVNDKAVSSDKVNVPEAGKIVLDKSLFTEAGNYSVRFESNGYADTKSIFQGVLEAGNLLINGSFDNGLDGWIGWVPTWVSIGSVSVVDGEAVMEVTGANYDEWGNCTNWSHQLKQENIEVDENDYYLLSFETYSTVNRPIELEFSELGTVSAEKTKDVYKVDNNNHAFVNIGTDKKTYYVALKDIENSKAASILFMGGNVDGCLEEFVEIGEHKIYFDNISLKAVTEQELDDIISESEVKDALEPVISGQPKNAVYTYGNQAKALTVTASSPDGGTLSFQWYQNNKNQIGGTKIAGATNESYTPVLKTAGIIYYYCIVTNTNADASGIKTAEKNSAIASVQVKKAVNSLKADHTVTKTYGAKAFTLKASGQGTITFQSSDKKVVTVHQTTGKVTIKGTGKATVTVTAAGNDKYEAASKKITITVKPKKATLKSFKSKKRKQAMVTWKKDAKATGYEIEYSTDRKFKKGVKKLTIKKNKTTSKTIKKLQGGKRYYVRVRAYKASGKSKVYGDYSKAKSVTVKK